MTIDSIFREINSGAVPAHPPGYTKKRGKGKPRLSPDSVRRQITMTIELAIWRQFVEKCTAEDLPQAEALRQLIHGWIEEDLTPTPGAAII